jgi:homoserine kinase type II
MASQPQPSNSSSTGSVPMSPARPAVGSGGFSVPGSSGGSKVSSGGSAAASSQSGQFSAAPVVGSRTLGEAQAEGSSQVVGDGRTRDRFEMFELAIVLSHYNIGTIEALQEFPRGSRKAPKLILRTDTGMFLLKRRARGKDTPEKVAFCHALQLYLASKQFPLPHLIGTRKENNSMLILKGTIYELFEFIKGTPFDNSLEATADSGKILALFHKLLLDYHPEFESAAGSYHNGKFIHPSMAQMPLTLAKVDARYPSHRERLLPLFDFLLKSYLQGANKVNEMGCSEWPQQIVHSDWHTGNMLYRGSRVVAVIDYDTARFQQRIIDIANGALQFSMVGGGDDPAKWPDYIDESRFKRFLRGYDSVPDCVLTKAELRAVPWLMIEALIAEAVIPIAATGSFARMDGISFLYMLERKVRWLQERVDHLSRVLES